MVSVDGECKTQLLEASIITGQGNVGPGEGFVKLKPTKGNDLSDESYSRNTILYSCYLNFVCHL